MASKNEDSDRDFNSSELGTKEYWDEAYNKEVTTFEDIGDVGEIWFGEDTMERVVQWVEDSDEIQTSDSIIDLGCGNGMMLIELRKCKFSNLTGVDYADGAITLAKAIAKSEGFEDIEYSVGDLIGDDSISKCTCLTRKYKVCLDKGTYDAISLMPGDAKAARLSYLNTVKGLMNNDSLFILTSCNWSKDQLVSQLEADFEVHDQIPFRTFQFGGQTGSTVTSLVCKLKKS